MMVTIGMMNPLTLIDKIERRNILRMLNTVNVFDFEYNPSKNDQLDLNFEEEDGYKFTFKKGKWVLEEWYGYHPVLWCIKKNPNIKEKIELPEGYLPSE
jgi:hypothetical protein